MVPITFYKWLNMQFNSPLLALCIICITDLPFIILAGYAISIRQNDYNLLIIQYMLFGSISMNDYLAPSTLNLVNVFNSFVWANITVFYLAEVSFTLNSKPTSLFLFAKQSKKRTKRREWARI